MKAVSKKYKWYTAFKVIFFILSLACCTVPEILAAIKVSPTVETPEKKLALGGFAVFIIAVMVFMVFRSLIKKFWAKLPYTLGVFVSFGILLLLFLALKSIIDIAVFILWVGLIGAIAGMVFEIISMIFKHLAKEEKNERGQ